MYRKYFVYIDDGDEVYKIAIAAANEDIARDFCTGNGEIVAVRDVTEEYKISFYDLRKALQDIGRFDRFEIDFISRTLQNLDVVE